MSTHEQFWPFKSLMTSYKTQITIWSDGDRQDEQFRFYYLCQHMNSSKDLCQKCQPRLGPLFKGTAPILGIDQKVSFPTAFVQ